MIGQFAVHKVVIGTNISKANAHFAALNLFIPKKRFKERYRTSVNIEDLEVDFILQHFNLFLIVNKANECNLIEEEDSSKLLENFIAVNSQEGENLLAEIRDILPKRKRVIPSTNMITNMPAPDRLDKLLCYLQFFFKDQRKKD